MIWKHGRVTIVKIMQININTYCILCYNPKRQAAGCSSERRAMRMEYIALIVIFSFYIVLVIKKK